MLQFSASIIAVLQFSTAALPLVAQSAQRESIASCRVITSAAGRAIDVGVLCPRGVRYRILLPQAPHCGLPRTMSSGRGRNAIHYFLLTPDRSGIWCDGTNGTQAISGIGNGGTQHYVASSRILEGGAPTAGSQSGQYADTVTVFLEKP